MLLTTAGDTRNGDGVVIVLESSPPPLLEPLELAAMLVFQSDGSNE
jgi:hypothetical protein